MASNDPRCVELLRLMRTRNNGDWGPNPIVCRWCGCWLEYGDGSREKIDEEHDPACFAVQHLNRPARKSRHA